MNLIFFKESLERLDFQPLDNLYKERDFDFFNKFYIIWHLILNLGKAIFLYTPICCD